MANVVGFKIVKNVLLLIGGQLYQPPHANKAIYDTNTGYSALVATFDMDKRHTIPVPDTTPVVPLRRPEWNDDFCKSIEQAAYAEAIAKRQAARELADSIKHFVKNGTIAILDDDEGFLESPDLIVSDAELKVAAAIVPAKKAAK